MARKKTKKAKKWEDWSPHAGVSYYPAKTVDKNCQTKRQRAEAKKVLEKMSRSI